LFKRCFLRGTLIVVEWGGGSLFWPTLFAFLNLLLIK